MNIGGLILYVILFAVLFAINPIEAILWFLISIAWGFFWPWLNRNRQRFGQFSPLWFLFMSFFLISYVVLRLFFTPIVAIVVPGIMIALCAQYVLAVPYLISEEHYTLADQLLTFQQQLNPNGMFLKFQRVALLNAQRQYKEALEYVNQIIDPLILKSDEPLGNLIPVNDNTVNAYTWRVRIALNLKDYDLALKDSERVVRMQPDKSSSYILRGSVHTAQGRFEQAQADFDRAASLPLDPNEEIDLLQQRSRLVSQRDKGSQFPSRNI